MLTVSICFYLIKCQARQKRLLPFHDADNEFKKFCVNNALQKIESKNELKEVDIKNHRCYN